jgi:hypothetical protein
MLTRRETISFAWCHVKMYMVASIKRNEQEKSSFRAVRTVVCHLLYVPQLADMQSQT